MKPLLDVSQLKSFLDKILEIISYLCRSIFIFYSLMRFSSKEKCQRQMSFLLIRHLVSTVICCHINFINIMKIN